MASIKDVAKLAGVSVSTVSRVINNSEYVEKNTKVKVLEAINKLDYKPNLLAKGLRIKSGNIIGLAIPEVIVHAFIYIINYTLETASRNGLNLILGCTHDNPDIEEKFIDDLIRRNVNGIIFSRVSDESRVLRIIHKMNIPIVVIDRALDNEGIPHVILNNHRAGVIAANHFIELGHRDIACVTGQLNIGLCRERLAGFQETLKKNGIDLDEGSIYEGDFKFESGLEAVKYFYENNTRPTAIWAQNDLMALGVKRELLEKGVNIPDDVSLVGMDDIGVVRMVKPALTTIAQPFKQMCEKAMELILIQNEKKELTQKMIILEPNLIERDSTGYYK